MTSIQQRVIRVSAGIGAFLIAALLIGFWSDYFARQTVPDIFPRLDTVSVSLPATTGNTIAINDLKGQHRMDLAMRRTGFLQWC